jgi:endonuclease G
MNGRTEAKGRGLAFCVLVCVLASCAAPATQQPSPELPAAVARSRASFAADAFAASVHVALGVPKDAVPDDDVLIDHGVFVLSYNPTRRLANWVAWRLTAADLGTAARSKEFRPDPLLPSIYLPVLPNAFRGTGYVRGHMCPSADRKASARANAETFVMTNVQPQVRELNGGPWERLEHYERKLAERGKVVFLVAGGLFDDPAPSLRSGIAVPRANFKVLVSLEPGQDASTITRATRTYAVIMPNVAAVGGTSWTSHLTTIDEVERQSGYDLLSAVEAGVQEGIEGRAPIWPN